MKFHVSMVFGTLDRCSACPKKAELAEGKLICGADGKEIRWLDPGYVCPDGRWVPKVSARWDEKTDTYWLDRPDAELEKQYDQDHDRIPGQLRWKVRRLGAVAKAMSLGAALLSGDASQEVMETRKKSCFGDPEKGIQRCTSLTKQPQGTFCGTCSCNRWPVANLDNSWSPKYTKLNVNCPMRKPGFANSPPAGG